MNKLYITLAILVCVTANPTLEQLESYTFANFKSDYGRAYVNEVEAVYRQAIFEENLAKIKAHNAKGLSWWETVNQFADWTQEEFEGNMLGLKMDSSLKKRKQEIRFLEDKPEGWVSVGDLPDSFDW